VLDSLRGYDLAMAEFATPVANIQNMTSYLKRHLVTSILINEIEGLSGSFLPTELGVSYVADNILLLRYAETTDRVVASYHVSRSATAISSERSDPSTFSRTKESIVGDQLNGYSGLLHSVPTSRSI
jgi:circadian clock protein KaiC